MAASHDDPFILQLQGFEQTIGYAFQHLALLEQALTHRSFGPVHNERLEYLGDSILGMVIARKLYELFPQCPEGDLTRMRSSLVRETTLAQLAREFNLGQVLRLGPGELKTGGSRRDSLLADAVESVIGAMFIDSRDDYDLVRERVLSWFASRLKSINPKVNQKDHKSSLQEKLQAEHCALPQYTVIGIRGNDNNQVFDIELRIDGCPKIFTGSGTSKRRAEQDAAGQALDFLASGKVKL